MKKFLKLTALSMVMTMLLGAVNVFAIDPVTVFVDGFQVIYTDAQPTIENSRTIVPIRATAEKLGLEIQWNKDTEVMTFTKGSDVVSHKMRTNVISINGVESTFDTPSVNRDNRILMPVRMLAEAIGCQVNWDNDKRQVLIVSSTTSVESAEVDKTNAFAGQNVKFTVVANSQTTKVKAVNSSSKEVLAESSQYTVNSNGTKTFTIDWTANTSTSQLMPVEIYAGTDTSYNQSANSSKTVYVNVSTEKEPKIITFKADERQVTEGEIVEVKVYANSDTTKVKISTNFNSGEAEFSDYVEEDDMRMFEASIKMNKEGENEIYFCAGNSGGYSESKETLSVEVSEEYDDNNRDEETIEDVRTTLDTVGTDETIKVYVQTSDDIDSVKIYDYDDNVVAREDSPEEEQSGYYYWLLELEVDEEGNNKYEVYAYNEDDDEVDSKSFKVTGSYIEKSETKILNIIQVTDYPEKDEGATIEVRTTPSVSYIEILDSSLDVINTIKSPSDEENRAYTFKTSVDGSSGRYYVYAYNENGTKATADFTLVNIETDEPEITDFDIEDDSLDKGDDVQLTVYTTKNIEQVWVEDEDNDRKARLKSPTKEKGSEYVWELSFEAETKGTLRYTIYAKTEDDDEITENFRIKVR